MPLSPYLGSAVNGPVDRVIAVKRVEITGGVLLEQRQRYDLLCEFHFS